MLFTYQLINFGDLPMNLHRYEHAYTLLRYKSILFDERKQERACVCVCVSPSLSFRYEFRIHFIQKYYQNIAEREQTCRQRW